MKHKYYQICNRCVMDTTDPVITFDDNGNCNYCNSYLKKDFAHSSTKENQLRSVIKEIKKSGEGKKYDCIIGLSGGVDSTYVAYEVKKRGLRPLAVHLDNGWNSDLAISNIKKCLNKLDIDLYVYTIDEEEFIDLQRSFLHASIPGMEIPTDHAILSILNIAAIKNNIRYIINGSNNSSEFIMSPRWSEGIAQRDWLLIKNIHKKFGGRKLKTFPKTSMMDNFKNKLLHKLTTVNLLNYIDYSKEKGKKIIEEELDWVYYGGKHYESIYTRFTQAYIQPKKFNIDKRKAHHSNLICAGEMTREAALLDIQNDPYPDSKMKEEDKLYFMDKMGMAENDFNQMMNAPVKSYLDYPGYYNHYLYKKLYNFGFKVHNCLKQLNYYGKRAE